MANPLTARPGSARRGWASRLLSSFTGGQPGAPRGRADETAPPRPGMARQPAADDRHIFVPLKEAADNIAEADAALGWRAIADKMAMVPTGVVPVVHANGGVGPVEVAAFYLDRHAV